MNSKIISNNRPKLFSNLKMILNNFLNTDIDDENSGLDIYINKDIQSESDKQDAETAQILKEHLLSMEASHSLENEKSSKRRTSSTTRSLKTTPTKISSEISKGKNIHTISMNDDRDLSL